MALGGIDIGTTGCKITLYTEDGVFIKRIYRGYEWNKASDAHEINPEIILASVFALLRESAQIVSGISAIGITSFGESFVLLDEEDKPLYPSLLYTDPRGEDQIQAFAASFGSMRLSHITGTAPAGMYSLAKILWIKENEPQLLHKAQRLLLIQDYIVYMLTGNAQIDYSLAARSMLFDIRERTWSQEILDAISLPRHILSTPVPSGTIAGPIKPDIARQTALPLSLNIVSCSHDQIAATIGSGVLECGTAADGAGTVQCITPVLSHLPEDNTLYDKGYAFIPYIHPGWFATYAFCFTGGSLIQWYLDTLAGFAHADASSSGQSVHAVLEGSMTTAPSGILVLPHFAGAGTPYMDNGSKGVIAGLDITTSSASIYKALMEGIAYEMRLNLDLLRKANITVNKLCATGGGARSKAWLQIKADIMNIPIVSLENSDAGTLGGIILTGIAANIFPDIKTASKILIREEQVFLPRPSLVQAYEELYQKYIRLYDSVRALV